MNRFLPRLLTAAVLLASCHPSLFAQDEWTGWRVRAPAEIPEPVTPSPWAGLTPADITPVDLTAEDSPVGRMAALSATSSTGVIDLGLQRSVVPTAMESISELARGLDNDLVKCYLFVRDNIKFTPYPGILRGPERTLLDREGNDADQAFLLLALLQASGYEATILHVDGVSGVWYAPLGGSADDYNVASWLGTSGATANDLWVASASLLANAGLYCDIDPRGSNPADWYVLSTRYWVGVIDGNELHHLDPAYKPRRKTPPRNLVADMSYTRSSMLSAAGGTVDSTSVRELSVPGIDAKLNSLSAQMAATWTAAAPVAAPADFIGGDAIVAQNMEFDNFAFHGYVGGGYSDFLAGTDGAKNAVRAALAITHGGATTNLWIDEIAARHVWLSYATSTNTYPKAVLRVDDTAILTEAAGSSSNRVAMTLAVSHPVAPMTAQYDLTRGLTNVYVVALGMGGDAPGGMRTWAAVEQAKARASGLADASPALLSRTLQLAAQQWLSQTTLLNEFQNRVGSTRQHFFYNIGVAGQASATYVDLKNCFTYSTGNAALFDGYMLFASAIEHAVLDQLNGTNRPAVSTVKLLDIANASSDRVYFAAASNYGSIRGALTGYSIEQLDAFATTVAAGRTLLLPKSGQLTLNQWTGCGYIEHGPSGEGYSTGMMIGGRLNGGFGSYAALPDNTRINTVVKASYLADRSKPEDKRADPVALPSGAFLDEALDLALAGPVPLSWSRHYDTRARFDDGPLGRGWSHGYQTSVVLHADPDALMGRASPAACVPTAVACAVVADLLSEQSGLTAGENARRRTLAALVVQWWTRQLTEAAVSVHAGSGTLAFQRVPGGVYMPALGVTATLAETNGLFTLTERLGDTYAFDASNRLASVTDRSGNATAFQYASNGQLSTVSNNFGRALSLTWSGARVASVSDGTGRSVSYGYDAVGCLTNVVDPAGFRWNYAYATSTGALISKADPEGNVTIRNVYNGLGQVTGQVSSAGQAWAFGYAADVEAWDEDPIGRRLSARYTPEGRVVLRIDRDGTWNDYTHDARGNLVTNIDPIGRANLFDYDAHDNLVRATQAANTTNARATAFAYDNRHRLVGVTNALGLVTTFAYDDKDRLTLTTFADGTSAANTWNAAGLRASATLLDAAGHPLRHTDFTYDAAGRPASISVPSVSSVVNFSFDAAGNLVRLADANGRETHFHYDVRGLLTNTVDAAGHSAATAYDGRGLPATVTDARSNTTAFRWTPSGDPAAVLLPDGTTVTNVYDAVDRLAAVTDPRGTRIDFERDAMGRVTRRHTPRWQERTWYDIVGCATSVLDAASVWTDIGYDWLDRPLVVTDGLGREWWTAFDALDRVSGTTDPRGRTRQYAHDPLGRRTAAIRPSGATDSFGTDGLGNWTTYTNAEGHVYTMTYDALSRPLAATNAANEQVFANRYDPAGNLTNRLDGAGNATRYAYDELNRLVTRDIFHHEEHEGHEGFSYDAVGNLLSASNAVAQESFTYDVMDRVASATTTVNGHTFASQWKRDLGGLVTNLVYAPGKAASRAYAPGGRLASVSDWLGHTWTFAWDGAGKLTGGTSPSGILSTNTYDAAGRLASWSVGTLAGRTITRDAAGLKTRDDITAGPLPAPHNVRYAENTFDAADSLVAASVRYGSHTNAAVPETYLYDGNGALTNLISGFTNVFSAAYNPLGQLSSLRSSAFFAANYLYDALGNRIVSGDRLWIPDHADLLKRPLIEADAATGTPIRYYLWAPGRLLGFIDADSGTLTVAHCDEYGSVVALTDASGAVLHTACYGPNGQDWGTTGGNPTPFAWLGGHGVQKAAVSDHLGPLYLTRYRLYSASLNRFLSPDPLGLAGGLNLYAYAEGDPLSYIDPLGLCAKRDYSHDAHNSELWAYRPPPYYHQPTATLYDTTRDPRSRALMHSDMLLPEAAIGTAVGDHLATSMTIDTFTAPGLAIIGGGISKAVGKVLGGAKNAIQKGDTVYRVWGGKSGPWGESWTTVNPNVVPNLRSAAGLPDVNAGRFVSEGILQSTEGVTSRGALIIKSGQQGGLPEVMIKGAEQKVLLQRVSGVNPEF